MRLQPPDPVVQAPDIFHQADHLTLDEMCLFAHAHILEHRLNDLNGQHQKGWRNDDDARTMGFLHNAFEILVNFGKNGFRGDKEKCRILGFAIDQVFL